MDDKGTSYLVVKHSWKGKYKRVMVIEPHQISTLDPKNIKITNSWPHDEVIDAAPLNGDLFKLVLRKKSGNTDLLKFSSDFHKEILCDITRFHPRLQARSKKPTDIEQDQLKFDPLSEALISLHEFEVYKLNKEQTSRTGTILCLANSCLVERNPQTYEPIIVKSLNDIFSLIRSPDNSQVIIIEFNNQDFLTYSSTARDALLASLLDSARSSGNINIHVKMIATNPAWRCGPLHILVDDEIERGHLKAFQNLPPGWNFIDAIYRFNTICPYSGLTHFPPQDNKLFVESKSKLIEAALTSIVDQAEAGSIPLKSSTVADVEQYYQAIRRLVASKAGFALFNQSERLRAYLGHSIVRTIKLNDDAITYAAFDVLSVLMQPMHPDCDIRDEYLNKKSLLATKEFLESLIDVLKLHVDRGTGALVVSSMLDFLTYALCEPYSETTDSSCFDTLLNLIASNGEDMFKLFQHPSFAIVKSAGLVIKAIIQEGEPSVSKQMQQLSLYKGALLRHLQIGLFSEVGRSQGVQYLSRNLVALWSMKNQDIEALFKRIFPLGLLNYLNGTEKPPQSMMTMAIRDNLKLADTSNPPTHNVVNTLRDIHPSVRVIEHQLGQTFSHWREQIGLPKRDERASNANQVVLRKCRQRVKVENNWDMFYYQFYQDHCKPDLIWNSDTREELKTAVENELRSFMADRDRAGKHINISWYHRGFKVRYKSWAEEIRIGDYFLRLLLQESENSSNRIQIRSPSHFLNDLYLQFSNNKRVDMRCTCLQAMAQIYGNYMSEIGKFTNIHLILDELKNCRNRTERDRLILLLDQLILNEENAEEFIDAGGVTVLSELVTLAHLHTERAFIPTQNNVIEATTEMLAAAASKEWFYIEDDNIIPSGRPGNFESDSTSNETFWTGPLKFSEVEELWNEGKISEKTRFWAQGLDGWKTAAGISQLKWCLMASGNPIMNESELATQILNIFIQICEHCPSRDLGGGIYRPCPPIKKFLSNSTCLPHIVQLLVTFDPKIVDRVSTLLSLVMEENPEINQLYRSGLFFFILMYSGSNLYPVGRLLHATHLAQAYRLDQTLNRKLKSFLNYLLPEAMVCYLENHGPDKFVSIFLGNHDTPEAIWNSEMRRTMIEKIACHVADFTSRMKSNNRATYDYCPIAPINYDHLEDELFVDIYYLRNLCNTVKFPCWPIKNPISFLRALLEAWKEETNRKPSNFSYEAALKVLGLDEKKYQNCDLIDEQAVKRSYRELALKYHPDKNPNGARLFQEVHKAYEFLSSKQARVRALGSNPKNLILILKAQSILFCHFNDELHPYKYPGYPMLIETVKKGIEDERLFSKPDPLLAYACETAYHTLRCSALNARELTREGGLEVLQQSLSRCASVLSASSKPDDVCAQICTNIVNCFTVAAEFEVCQLKLSEFPSVVKDLNRILSYKKLLTLLLSAAECIAAFAKCTPLHQILYDSGIIFSLILLLFQYDYSIEEDSNQSDEDCYEQKITNKTAKVALLATARLYELARELYEKPVEAMLTHYVASHFKEGELNLHEVLKILNSNNEIPYLIWNKATRAELVDYLEYQQRAIIQSGECPDESYGAGFEFSSHKEELIVGNIFIRVYNQQPSYALRDAAHFVQALLNYVGNQSQYIHSSLSLSSDDSLDPNAFKNVVDCLQALSSAIKGNPGVEVECVGYFKLLFSLLKINQLNYVQDMALRVIKDVTPNSSCVEDIENSNVLVYLWIMLYDNRKSNQILNNLEKPLSRPIVILETLLPLIAKSSSLVKETMEKGCLVYLVDLFCNSADSEIRLKSAELIAKITTDKQLGAAACLIMNRFLPMFIVGAIKNPLEYKTLLNLYDNDKEAPELIWNTKIRQHISISSSELAQHIYEEQVKDPTFMWQMKADFNLHNGFDQGELVVGGVYLRLFNKYPDHPLSKPNDFMTKLMDSFQKLIKSNEIDQPKLEIVTLALKNLLAAQPSLLENLSSTGHFESIVAGIYSRSNKNEFVSRSCLTILAELASSRACVDIISSIGTLLAEIEASMTKYDNTTDIACIALRKIYEMSPVNDRIVQQALEANLITHLMNILNPDHPNCALIVKVLKSMTTNQTYGQQVETMLSKSEKWFEYTDQKHDLFIPEAPRMVAIEASKANKGRPLAIKQAASSK